MNTPTVKMLAGAFRYWERRQQVVSNNLANAATDGFRAERVFARVLDGVDAPVAESRTDFRDGSVTQTGNPLDVALKGDGFLVLETADGERFSRGGSLAVDDAGVLVDAEGHAVLGESGPLVLPPGEIAIDARGRLSVDGEEVGRLRIRRFGGATPPRREGAAHFAAAATDAVQEATDTEVLQGHVEQSNVNPVEALVEMITVQRAYGALERSARTVDGVMETVANRLGRVD